MKKQSKRVSLNFIDLFSGAGGFSCGMEMAGHKCLLGVDIDKYAMETFAANHKYAHAYQGPIDKLTNPKLKKLLGDNEVHAVIGGPPCQGFSTVGTGNPNDIRNVLFLQFIRIVKFTRPMFVVMENVTGLLAKKNEKTLKAILQKFAGLGYHMDVKVLTSQSYGVPEKRRRTIFIGSRINPAVSFPRITHDAIIGKSFIPAKTVGEALNSITGNNVPNHSLESAQLKSTLDLKRLKRIPEGKGIRYQEDEKKYLTPSLYMGVEWVKLPERRFRQTKYQRLDRNKPSPTIMTHRWTYYHPIENRFLTAREGAALQSFPNNFVFKGPISAQWRQIGNAVPPLLGKAIGKALTDMFKVAFTHSSLAKEITVKKVRKKNIDQIRSRAFVYKEKKISNDVSKSN